MSGAPFTQLSRKVVVENRWHRYCHDRYVRRDGSEGEYWYVDMPGSCGIVPLFDDGSTLLLRVRRYVLDATLWEFPIGGMKDGEEPLAVARHELEQEAGLQARDWHAIGRFAPYKGVSNEICHFFVARGLTQVPQQLEEEEDISVHPMPFADAKRLLLEQELGDGQSWCGLLLAERWLARNGHTA